MSMPAHRHLCPAAQRQGHGRLWRGLFAVLCLTAPLMFAGAAKAGGVPLPTVQTDPTKGACVAPPAEMRRKHMDMLSHQRDRTLRQGERGAAISLNGCIDCHASKTTGSVIGSPDAFCESCHRYAAVKIDCFQCHQPRARAGQGLAVTSVLGVRP